MMETILDQLGESIKEVVEALKKNLYLTFKGKIFSLVMTKHEEFA